MIPSWADSIIWRLKSLASLSEALARRYCSMLNASEMPTADNTSR